MGDLFENGIFLVATEMIIDVDLYCFFEGRRKRRRGGVE